MRILLLAAEAAPLVQVTDVGATVGGLASALAEAGHDVRVALPFCGAIDRARRAPALAARVTVPHVGGGQVARVYDVRAGGVLFNLIAGPPIPPTRRVSGPDLHADGPKFIFTGLAALGLCRALGWAPDLVHGFGAPAGPVLYWLDTDGLHDPLFQPAATVFTPAAQVPASTGVGRYLLDYGLTPSDAPDLPDEARAALDGLAWGHAQVIARTSPDGLKPADSAKPWVETVLSARPERVAELPTGLDLEAWNPRHDRQLAARYDAASLDRRSANKRALQRAMGLPVAPNAPLMGVVSPRKADASDSDILAALLDLLAQHTSVQVALLGDSFEPLCDAFPERARRISAAVPASRFYAGVDLTLAPAHSQAALIALRYGAVPVVGAGGPVVDYAEVRRGTGFCFTGYNAGALLGALQRALHLYRQPTRWQPLQRRGMRQATQFAWPRTVAAYLALYQQASSSRKEAVTRLTARLADDPADLSDGSRAGRWAQPGLATLR